MIINVKVKSSTLNPDSTFTIETCNTQYLNKCSKFEYNGSTYFVEDYSNNEFITLSGTPQITGDFVLPSPFFISDTPRGTNGEFIQARSESHIFPFVWLLEEFDSDFDLRSTRKVGAKISVFFMNMSQEGEWLAGEHREQCILPMKNLADAFLNDVISKISGKIERYSVTNRIRFGKYRSVQGDTEKIIDENLSGIELGMFMPVKKEFLACDDCD